LVEPNNSDIMNKANVEHAEILSNPKLLSKDPAPGDVELLKGSETILIPTPSADPKGKIPHPATLAYGA
jgi:hypothetical protein